MGRLNSVTVLSLFFACSMVAAQDDIDPITEVPATNLRPDVNNPSSSYDEYSNRNRQWPQYKCRESSLNYDCIFHNVQIDINSPGAYFGYENVGINIAKKITFKNSTMRKLTNELVNSFELIELLDLTGLQIEKIATNAFTNGNNIRELYMGFNNIQGLPHGVFQHMGLLTTLVLDRNNLTSLPVNIFHNNPNLISLSLTNNNLMDIDDYTFKYCKDLQHLTVYSNKLTNFDLSQIPSLNYGNVSYNRLTTLAIPVAVAELDASYNEINTVTGPRNGNLNYLLLRKNNLTTTEWLLRYPGLVELDLSYNELEKISYHDFSKTVQLQKLYLSNNRLVALNLGPSPIRTLQILDVGHNHLVHVEKNQKQFDTLKQLYLDHNAIVTLKLSSNNTLERLTLSHNDWDCNNLDQLLQNVPETVMVGEDRNCKPEYILKRNLCCKISERPYLDRLIQFIREVSVVEKYNRAQGRCSVDETITSIQNLNDNRNQHGEGVQSNPQLLDEIDQLYQNVSQLEKANQQFQQYVDSMDTEIDNNVRRYRVTKAEKVNRIKNLRPVFEYLESRRAFKREQTLTRQSEAEQKKQARDNMEQENETLQKQLNAKKAKQIEIANETKAVTKAVKKLEARINKNPRTAHITK